MLDLSKLTVAELKEVTRQAIAVNNRKMIDRIKAETLFRAAKVIAEGRDTPELCEKVIRLTESMARKG